MTHTLTPEAIALLDAAVARELAWSRVKERGTAEWTRVQVLFSKAAETYARSLEPKEPK